MIKFSKEKVLLLHQIMAEATGGDVGLRDEVLLESAIENIYLTFDGAELYPSKEEKAARLDETKASDSAFANEMGTLLADKQNISLKSDALDTGLQNDRIDLVSDIFANNTTQQ